MSCISLPRCSLLRFPYPALICCGSQSRLTLPLPSVCSLTSVPALPHVGATTNSVTCQSFYWSFFIPLTAPLAAVLKFHNSYLFPSLFSRQSCLLLHWRIGCHQACMCVKLSLVMSDSVVLWIVACQALCLWDSPGKSTGTGCHQELPNLVLKPCTSPHKRGFLFR